MGMKNFDYKQFLLDHGERIGLGAAGVIALLLIASLFFPGMGFLSGSASSNADTLAVATKTVEHGLASNKPTEADNPGDTKAKLVAFNFEPINPKKAEEYSVAELFMPPAPHFASRQMPDLLLPKDSRAAVARLQIASFVFDNPDDIKQVLVLDDAPTTATAGGSADIQSPLKRPNMKAISEFYARAAASNPRMARRRRTKSHAGDGSDTEDFKSHFEDVAKIGSINDKKLAEEALPVRAAEIVAAFPYKAQVQEFRDKLGLASDEDVLAEPSQETGKDKQPLPAFRFLGVRLERRRVDAQGKPLDAQGQKVDDQGGWAEVNLEDSFKPLMILNGKRLEDEDPKLAPVEIGDHLVMPKLLTFGDRHVPPVDQYPKLEEKMPDLKATVDALNKDPNAVVVAPSINNRNFSIFDSDLAATGSQSMMPGGTSNRLLTPSRLTPGGSSRSLFRPSIGRPTGDTPSNSPFGAGVLQSGQSFTIPDYILIRLFDVTVEPGKTYEYRMQVRMGNPNRDRPDAASQKFGQMPELLAKRWYVLPEKVKVPLDVNYYAVDQAKLDAAAPKEPRDPNQPREPRVRLQLVKENQTVLQIQKWVESLKTKLGDQSIGDWVIADRVVATRGEPISPQKVEVPYWRKTQDRFTLLTEGPTRSGRRGPPMVDVAFSDGDAPIVVDFTGGDATYKRALPVTDKGVAVDVLLLMPDGTLAAHNSAIDAIDAKRVSRLKDNREWIRSVKNAKGGRDQTTPFGPPQINNINN